MYMQIQKLVREYFCIIKSIYTFSHNIPVLFDAFLVIFIMI